jgi:calcineurin-like phosphoesterase family protein
MLYFISDTHFSHTNILNYQQREFSDTYEMNSEMTKRWNATVKPNDTVYHLGDFAFHNKPKELWDLLNGNKIILKGNHDHRYIKKLPFEQDSIKLVKYNGYIFVLCHYPMITWQHKGYKSIHVHGHTHKGLPTDLEGRRFNVCVENIDYRPISADSIIQQIEDSHKTIRK